LRQIDGNNPHGAYDWALEFDARVRVAVDRRDANALAAPQKWGAHLLASAHPTAEHYLPLLYCAGAADEGDAVSHPYPGFEFGSISMRAVLFGEAAKTRSE
jgi:4,5-DOPA dioxygenase extradiol